MAQLEQMLGLNDMGMAPTRVGVEPDPNTKLGQFWQALVGPSRTSAVGPMGMAAQAAAELIDPSAERFQLWPERMLRSAATLPRDVGTGRVDPLSEEGIGRALDLAGLAMVGPAPKGGASLRSGYAPWKNKSASEIADNLLDMNQERILDELHNIPKNKLEQVYHDFYNAIKVWDDNLGEDPFIQNMAAIINERVSTPGSSIKSNMDWKSLPPNEIAYHLTEMPTDAAKKAFYEIPIKKLNQVYGELYNFYADQGLVAKKGPELDFLIDANMVINSRNLDRLYNKGKSVPKGWDKIEPGPNYDYPSLTKSIQEAYDSPVELAPSRRQTVEELLGIAPAEPGVPGYLTSAEKKAVGEYISGPHWTRLNNWLRGAYDPYKMPDYEGMSPVQREFYLRNFARNLDNAIERGAPVGDMTVYRGWQRSNPRNYPAPEFYEPGKVLEFPAYTSTSFEKDFAREWSGNTSQNQMFVIDVPRGAKGLDMTKRKVKGQPTNLGESEFLLPRGQKYMVLGTDRPRRSSPLEIYLQMLYEPRLPGAVVPPRTPSLFSAGVPIPSEEQK